MLEEYKKLDIDLGSGQYLHIANRYTLLNSGESELGQEYLDGLTTNRVKILKAINSHLQEVKDSMDIILAADTIKEALKTENQEAQVLLEEMSEDCSIWGSTPQEEFIEFKEKLSNSPFKFPVDPKLRGLALLELIGYMKNSSWDLWSACNTLRALMNFSIDRDELTSDGDMIYFIKELYELDDKTIEEYFGDFDT